MFILSNFKRSYRLILLDGFDINSVEIISRNLVELDIQVSRKMTFISNHIFITCR